MPKESHILPESRNMARVRPYLLRSLTKKDKEPEQPFIQSEWEDVRCVICMEPPHNAVLLTCSSSLSGCRAYMCDTGARHSNCYKQYRQRNKMRPLTTKTTKILCCPLCRGEVLKTEKVGKTARTFMNDKPKGCAFNDCEFSGTYFELCKHLNNEHCGLSPQKVDQERQWKWDQVDAGLEIPEVVLNLPVVQMNINVNGNLGDIISPINVLGLTEAYIARLDRNWIP